VGEARRLGLIAAEEAANLSDVPNIRQKGTRLGNWLTREQAKELLAVPVRSTLKGKRDYVILALLVGCALRRTELAELDVPTIQLRENRWVLADLEGKGRRIRTVAVPLWVKEGINSWMTAARIEEGRLLRSISKGGKVGTSLSDWTVWSVVEQSAREIGIEHEAAGAELLYLPPYSPDLNPIEKAWSKLKQYLRAVKARTAEQLQQAIADALKTITPSDAAAWFRTPYYAL